MSFNPVAKPYDRRKIIKRIKSHDVTKFRTIELHGN